MSELPPPKLDYRAPADDLEERGDFGAKVVGFVTASVGVGFHFLFMAFAVAAGVSGLCLLSHLVNAAPGDGWSAFAAWAAICGAAAAVFRWISNRLLGSDSGPRDPFT